jgi:hypothetical protein
MSPFDNPEYFPGPFTGGGYFPVNENLMTEADARGRAQAQAPAAGQQKAEDMAKEVERKAAAELDRKRMERLNMLIDSYRNPTAFDPNVGEQEIKRRAEMRGISVNEAKKIALNEQLQAEGRAQDFINKTNAYKQELQPLPTYSLGKDYFGRDIMTNRPASTAQEQAKRVAAFNQAPGSLTQFASASPEQRSELATNTAIQMVNESLGNRERFRQAAENGFAWNAATGRYERSNDLTSSQRAAMRERLKLGPSFTFGESKTTQTPAPASTTTPVIPTSGTPKPAPAPVTPPKQETITPASAPMASNEPTEDVVQPYTEAQKQPVLPVQVPTSNLDVASSNLPTPKDFYSLGGRRDAPSVEVDKLLASAGVTPDTTRPTAPNTGGSRRGFTAEDKAKADLAQARADLAKAESDLRKFSTIRFGRAQEIDKKAARKAAEKVVALRTKLRIQPGIEGGSNSMYTGSKN